MPFAGMTLDELAAYLDSRERLSKTEEALLQGDRRRGARLLLERYRRREESRLREDDRLHRMLREENYFWRQGLRLLPVDEGRGPGRAGCGCGSDSAARTVIAKDSKQLTATRQKGSIPDHEGCTGLGREDLLSCEIDRLNICGAACRPCPQPFPTCPGTKWFWWMVFHSPSQIATKEAIGWRYLAFHRAPQ